MAMNKPVTKISRPGKKLKIKKADTPEMLPKISPLNAPYPEVFGSISIMNTKNQLMRPNGFAFASI